MLYWLRHLESSFGPFRLFRYGSFRSMGAVVTALAVSLILGPWVIRMLKRFGAREQSRAFGGLNAIGKEGTPTMGGILILIGLFSSSLLWCDLGNPQVLIVMGAAIFFGALGAWDDYLKIRNRSSERGLSRGVKYLGQIIFGALIGVLFLIEPLSPFTPDVARTLTVPLYREGLYVGLSCIPCPPLFIMLPS